MTRALLRKPSVRLALAAVLLSAISAVAAQQVVGKQAWTQAAVSQGLHSLEQPATVTYRPMNAPPPGAVITQVYANRDYFGQADIQTSLCSGGLQHCVDIVGRSINTRAFNGLDARQPMYLVHRARAWRDSRPPVYVKGNITVWYDTAPRAD